MKNRSFIIVLVQGMFDKTTLTFNPGWNENAKNLDSLTGIRDFQKHLKTKGIKTLTEADEPSMEPAGFTI